MLMNKENMAYFAQRLRCTEEEKEACLKTVVDILRLRDVIRREGLLAIGDIRADEESDPFFRACLREAGELMGTEREPLMEGLFLRYLVAEDDQGGAFLRNVVIAEGVLQLPKLVQPDRPLSFRQWGEELSLAVRGYFGADYRERVEKTILRELQKHERTARETSFVPEFDTLAELPLALCTRLWQEVPRPAIAIALHYAGAAARERLTSHLSQERLETLEDDMELLFNLREVDIVTAQREVLEAAARYQA